MNPLEPKKKTPMYNDEEKEKLLRMFATLGRNDKCICGTGKKYKKCHLPLVEKVKRAGDKT